MLQTDKKKMQKEIKEGCLILLDGRGSRGLEANLSNEDIFFTLWFHLINLCLFEAGIYRDN